MSILARFALLAALVSTAASANPYRELAWRFVGPLRGGRTKAAIGVPGRPGLFYIGAVNGGVFKTDDFGRTWEPLFDDQPTGSIGALAVAASEPDVIYAGSGEGLHRPDLSTGDGLYKSVDGGKTWRHLGLQGGQQIAQIAVDPKNAGRLFVAVLGHPYGPNEERGVYRSLDGGEHFERVLYKDADTGAADVILDPSNPQIVFASLWEHREGPWENAEFSGPGSGLFKSTDGGTTWQPSGHGLPDAAAGLSRIAVAIAPSRPSRMFASVQAKKNGGLYRSDDAGASWTQSTTDARVTERDDLAGVAIHPKNPDIVFTNSVVVWKSIDGGKTFEALRGAPGGDDYLSIWIDPNSPDTMIIGSDQGALITVNGGRSFSSWYNQPTAQMFHVTADNAFPYRLCGGQQDSGSACVPSRGADGSITFRDWRPGAFEEYGYAAPDPLDPDILYGGKVSRTDLRSGQSRSVGPVATPRPDYRTVRTQPLIFSPLDPHTLYFGSNTLWKTTDGGLHWAQLSGDLSRKDWAVPASVGKYRGTEQAKVSQRGVIYTIAPSPLQKDTIWVGTDDGLIHLTRDGGAHWTEVTPPQLHPWAKVSLMDASHEDADTAYAAINTLRLDELQPHILRTRDGGKTWKEIVAGLPAGATVNVVREDPLQKGLLFAGTEQSVFVSFDHGDRWQSLRNNLPATSVRDLIIKGDDLAIATHGRGFWILDDLTPLRQAAASAPLLKPAVAMRVRFSTNSDTPLPPDEPAARNPPEGAILHYRLPKPAQGPVVLEILDAKGELVRRYSSDDKVEPPRDVGNVPRYWLRPEPRLTTEAGLHRFVWDLHSPPPQSAEPGYPMAAAPHDTPREPRGPLAVPGKYQVKLTVDGQSYQEPLEVKLDPRLHVPPAALQEQFDASMKVMRQLERGQQALAALRELRKKAPQLEAQLKALEQPEEEGRRARRGKAPEAPTLVSSNGQLEQLLHELQRADAAPTPLVSAAVEAALRESQAVVARLSELQPK